MSLEIIEPWRTAIHRKTVSEVDADSAVAEIFSTLQSGAKRDGVYGQDASLYNPEVRPYLSQLHDDVLVPAILEYIRQEYDLDLSAGDIKTSLWFIYGEDNPGLDVHSHNGAQISSVMHLVANPGDLVLLDPRYSASRGYPGRITKRHFANYHITPEKNVVHVFPSYLQHYVQAAPGKFRVSLACDAFFGDPQDY